MTSKHAEPVFRLADVVQGKYDRRGPVCAVVLVRVRDLQLLSTACSLPIKAVTALGASVLGL